MESLCLLALLYYHFPIFLFRVLIRGQDNLVTTSYKHYNGYYTSQEVSSLKIIVDWVFSSGVYLSDQIDRYEVVAKCTPLALFGICSLYFDVSMYTLRTN